MNRGDRRSAACTSRSRAGEKARLEQLKTQVDEFERQKGVLQQRINVIEQLQRNRTGGQELLDALANTVTRTDTLWLTSLDRKGDGLTIHGHGRIDQRRGQFHHPAQALRLLRPGRDQGIDAGHQERGRADVYLHADGAVRAAARQVGACRPRRQRQLRRRRGRAKGKQWRYLLQGISLVHPGAGLRGAGDSAACRGRIRSRLAGGRRRAPICRRLHDQDTQAEPGSQRAAGVRAPLRGIPAGDGRAQ